MTMTDFTACALEGVSGAHCNNFYTNVPVNYTQAQWDAMSFGSLCVGPQDYDTIKNELDEACVHLSCTYEQKAAMQSFFNRMTPLVHQ